MGGRGAIVKISAGSRNNRTKLPDYILEGDEIIARSLSAKAKNYDIKIPGEKEPAHYVEGSEITNIRVFAGYKTRNKLREETLDGLSEKYPEFKGKRRLWQHGSEEGIINTKEGPRRAEVHWFRNGSSGEKIMHTFKRWID